MNQREIFELHKRRVASLSIRFLCRHFDYGRNQQVHQIQTSYDTDELFIEWIIVWQLPTAGFRVIIGNPSRYLAKAFVIPKIVIEIVKSYGQVPATNSISVKGSSSMSSPTNSRSLFPFVVETNSPATDRGLGFSLDCHELEDEFGGSRRAGKADSFGQPDFEPRTNARNPCFFARACSEPMSWIRISCLIWAHAICATSVLCCNLSFGWGNIWGRQLGSFLGTRNRAFSTRGMENEHRTSHFQSGPVFEGRHEFSYLRSAHAKMFQIKVRNAWTCASGYSIIASSEAEKSSKSDGRFMLRFISMFFYGDRNNNFRA